MAPPSPSVDVISAMMIVWRIRGRILSELFSAVLYTTVVHKDMHTRDQFLKLSVLVLVFGRLFVKRFALCYQTIVCLSVCLSCLSCLSVTLVYCDQTVGRIQMKPRTQVGLGLDHTVLDGDSGPLPKGAQPHNFRPISVVTKWLDRSRCQLVGR